MTVSTSSLGSRPKIFSLVLLIDQNLIKTEVALTDKSDYLLPKWAPRVRKAKIAQFYKAIGRGIIDSDIIDEVGYALYERCISILEASSAVMGKVHCPNCRNIISTAAILVCSECGWECPRDVYQKTYQRKSLTVGGFRPFVKAFADQFPKEKSASKRLILIDTLIHSYHWGAGGGRPGASSLIEGKLKDIMPFLDKLNYGDQVPPEVESTRETWRQQWQKSSFKRQVEQRVARNRK